MKKMWVALAAASVALCPAGALAQERMAVKPGFAFPADKQVKIVVFRPDVSVGTQTTGALSEPNADWTATARKEIADALRKNNTVAGAKLMFMDDDPVGEDGAYLAEYRALFTAVAQAIQTNRLFVGARLPTKKDQFDWTLGDGAARIGQITGADYALFFYTNDAYGSAGRKAVQAMGMLGCLVGVCVIVPSGVHVGYAGLVDLKTGDVIWLIAERRMGGDVRTSDGAAKRVNQMLNGFPGLTPAPLPAAAPAAK